jgi:hypothetical protein
LNIQTYSQNVSFNELMTIIPEFMVDLKFPMNSHYDKTSRCIADVINFLNELDTIGRSDWSGFLDELTEHIEGMTSDIVKRTLANFYSEQQKVISFWKTWLENLILQN